MEEAVSTFKSVVEEEKEMADLRKTPPGRKFKPCHQVKPETRDGPSH